MHTAASCHAVAKQTSIETSVIHVSTRIDLHSSNLSVNWHLKLQGAHSCQLQLQNKLQWKHLSSTHWFAFIHGSTDIWNSNVFAAAARCQLQNKLQWKQNCHPVIYSHWFAFIQSICQLTSDTNVHGGQKKKDLDTVHSCQLPLAKPGGHWFPTSALVEKDTSSDLCMTAEGNLIDQRCKTLNGKRVCKFDFFYSHLFIWFHKKWLIRVSDRCGINKCISIKEKNVQWFHCQHLHVERTL